MKVWFTVDAAPRCSDVEKVPENSPLRKKVYRMFWTMPTEVQYTDYHYKEGNYRGFVEYNVWAVEDDDEGRAYLNQCAVIDKSEIPEGLDVTYENSPVEADIEFKLK